MSDNHKNTLKTAWNDITGDTIRTGKGSQSKYADNWEGIFGKKEGHEVFSQKDADEWYEFEPPMELGHFVVDDSCVEPMSVTTSGYMCCQECGHSFKFYYLDRYTCCPECHVITDHQAPTSTVMALDFHDGAK